MTTVLLASVASHDPFRYAALVCLVARQFACCTLQRRKRTGSDVVANLLTERALLEASFGEVAAVGADEVNAHHGVHFLDVFVEEGC